jgi:signal transduction histidine kinase
MTIDSLTEHHGSPGERHESGEAVRVLFEQATRAEAERRRYARMVRALAEATPAIHASLSVETLLQTAAREACSVLGAQRAYIAVQVDPSSVASRVVASFPPAGTAVDDDIDPSGAWPDGDDTDQEPGIPGAMRMPSSPILSRSDDETPGPPRKRLTVALRRRDGARIGFLQVDAADRHFQETDDAVVMQLAHTVAVAVENARLYTQLREATRARDEFVAVVSHDLRSPLGTVQLATWQIRELCGSGPAPLEKAVRCVERSVANMNRLIENLVEVSRVDAGRMILDLADVPLPPLLDAAITQARPNAEAASVKLSLRAAAGLARVRADRHRLLQIVSNLLVNALKFAPAGGEILLLAEPLDEGVRITVRGANLNFDPEAIAHLFDRFWQSKDARYRALGLGLYVAKNVMSAHGGALTLEEEPEGGYAFHLTLPCSPSLPG